MAPAAQAQTPGPSASAVLDAIRSAGTISRFAIGAHLDHSGAGAGIVLDGNAYRGSSGNTGEVGKVGHMSLDLSGPLCWCGTRGCVEVRTGRARHHHAARRAHARPPRAGLRRSEPHRRPPGARPGRVRVFRPGQRSG